MKVSEWLKEFNSHSIYAHDVVGPDFEKSCGQTAPWQPYRAYTAGDSCDRRLTTLKPDVDINELLVGGFEMAEACAKKWASATRGYHLMSRMSGRGSRFRAAIEALQEAGV